MLRRDVHVLGHTCVGMKIAIRLLRRVVKLDSGTGLKPPIVGSRSASIMSRFCESVASVMGRCTSVQTSVQRPSSGKLLLVTHPRYCSCLLPVLLRKSKHLMPRRGSERRHSVQATIIKLISQGCTILCIAFAETLLLCFAESLEIVRL